MRAAFIYKIHPIHWRAGVCGNVFPRLVLLPFAVLSSDLIGLGEIVSHEPWAILFSPSWILTSYCARIRPTHGCFDVFKLGAVAFFLRVSLDLETIVSSLIQSKMNSTETRKWNFWFSCQYYQQQRNKIQYLFDLVTDRICNWILSIFNLISGNGFRLHSNEEKKYYIMLRKRLYFMSIFLFLKFRYTFVENVVR